MSKAILCKWEVRVSGRVGPIIITARNVSVVVKAIKERFPEIDISDITSISYLAY